MGGVLSWLFSNNSSYRGINVGVAKDYDYLSKKIAIYGPRNSGKTTFVKRILEKLSINTHTEFYIFSSKNNSENVDYYGYKTFRYRDLPEVINTYERNRDNKDQDIIEDSEDEDLEQKRVYVFDDFLGYSSILYDKLNFLAKNKSNTIILVSQTDVLSPSFRDKLDIIFKIADYNSSFDDTFRKVYEDSDDFTVCQLNSSISKFISSDSKIYNY